MSPVSRVTSLTRADTALAALLLVAYGWLFVFFPRVNNPNELVRVYMARAIAEQGTYSIGERAVDPTGNFVDRGPVYSSWGYVNDKALVCADARARPPGCAGKLYAAKAPGISLLGAPVVAAARAVAHRLGHREPTRDELVFALRWLLMILPTIALWLFVRRYLLAARVEAPLALTATLAGACGSMSLTYGQMAAGHQLGSCALGLSFLAAFWPGDGRARLRASLVGFGLALAVCAEYPCAPAALLIAAGWLFFRRPGLRPVLFALCGAAGPALLLAHFHTAAFGAPWRTPYSALENPGFVRDMSPGFMGISLPTPERLFGSLFSPALGLYYWAPWTALALATGYWYLRDFALEGGVLHDELEPTAGAGVTASLVVTYYLFFQLTQALWRSGWSIGPRYITPIVPFCAVAVALGLQQLGRPQRGWALAFFSGAAAAGICATGLASSVSQGFPLEIYNPLVETVRPLLAHGYLPRNLLQLAGIPGIWSGLPYFAAIAIAAALCISAAGGRRAVHLAGTIFLLLSLAQWTATAGVSPDHLAALRYLTNTWTPALPPGARPFAK